MSKLRAPGVAAALCIILPFCAGHEQRPLIDPSVLTFPLVEAGRVDIEGTVVGQPRARDGVVYLATREGFLTAVVASSQAILWRFKAGDAFAAGPEFGQDHIVIRDRGNTLYVLESRGEPVLDAVTSLMKEVGYGKDYQYAHDSATETTDMETMPERLRGRRYYEPGNLGFEKEIKKRIEWWENLKARIKEGKRGGEADSDG